jgi:hypothetical protein
MSSDRTSYNQQQFQQDAEIVSAEDDKDVSRRRSN